MYGRSQKAKIYAELSLNIYSVRHNSFFLTIKMSIIFKYLFFK